jgi:hypothetical protein
VRCGSTGSIATHSRSGARTVADRTDLGALQAIIGDTRPADLADDRTPLIPAVETLIGRRVRRGAIVAVEGGVACSSLAAALLAGVSAGGGWCGVVGLPGFGFAGARGLGVRTETLIVVDEPGPRWADVVAALLGAVEVALVRPPERVPGRLARRLAGKARESRCTLVTVGPAWEGSDVRVSATRQEWFGLGQGHGHLRARRVTAVASSRPGAEVDLWLPAQSGGVTVDADRTPAAFPRRAAAS